MSTCDSCKHWAYTKKPSKNSWGHANRNIFPHDPVTYEPLENKDPKCGVCESPDLRFYTRPNAPYQATVEDGSEYYAGLITAEKFGCVNWEEK